MTIIIYLPENYRYDHFNLSVRLKHDVEEFQREVDKLTPETTALQAAVDAETKPQG